MGNLYRLLFNETLTKTDEPMEGQTKNIKSHDILCMPGGWGREQGG